MNPLKKLLIIAYYHSSDPVFRSAVLPYFYDFPNFKDFEFYLITFEDKNYVKSIDYVNKKDDLKANNIIWIPVIRLNTPFKFINRLYEFIAASFRSIVIIFRKRINGVYSEGFPSALLGFVLCLITQRKHLIHTFEPHADYMLEGGTWSKYSWKYQFMKRTELLVAKNAYKIFTATALYIDYLKRKGIPQETLEKVPSCIDTKVFTFNADKRAQVRKELGFNNEHRVICYLGKFGGMYLKEEAFELFETFIKYGENKYRILIITPNITDEINELVTQYNLNNQIILCSLANSHEVSAHLSAADVGFVAVRQKPSKRYCSPIKTGEYLSCGLPVIVPRGISDDDLLMEKMGIGVVLENMSAKYYKYVFDQTEKLFQNGTIDDIKINARNYCMKTRSISQYKFLYEKIFKSL